MIDVSVSVVFLVFPSTWASNTFVYTKTQSKKNPLSRISSVSACWRHSPPTKRRCHLRRRTVPALIFLSADVPSAAPLSHFLCQTIRLDSLIESEFSFVRGNLQHFIDRSIHDTGVNFGSSLGQLLYHCLLNRHRLCFLIVINGSWCRQV